MNAIVLSKVVRVQDGLRVEYSVGTNEKAKNIIGFGGILKIFKEEMEKDSSIGGVVNLTDLKFGKRRSGRFNIKNSYRDLFNGIQPKI